MYADFVSDDPEEEGIPLTANEIDQAEHNISVVLETAARTSEVLSKWTKFNIAPLLDLARDLKSVLALVRREMNQRPGCRNYNGSKPAAEKRERIPKRLRPKDTGRCGHDCLCPLTKFLQLVADALSDLNLRFRPSDRVWENITPLWGLLNRMQALFQRPTFKPRKVKNPEDDQELDLCPGIATVIMFHERHGRFVVTGTAPRFVRLTGLQKHAFAIREAYIREMEHGLPENEVERIRALIQFSEGVKQASKAARMARPHREPNIGPVPGGRGTIAGCNASFGNTGRYRRACLMDFFRFDISRPNAAQVGEERLSVIQRLAFEPRSCAEWELYVTILHRPDPAEPREPPKAVRHDTLTGRPKPATWDTNNKNHGHHYPPARQQPHPVTSRPQPLPSNLRWPQVPPPVALAGGPRSGIREGKSPSTFDQKTPPRHPATTQIIRPKKRSCWNFK